MYVITVVPVRFAKKMKLLSKSTGKLTHLCEYEKLRLSCRWCERCSGVIDRFWGLFPLSALNRALNWITVLGGEGLKLYMCMWLTCT